MPGANPVRKQGHFSKARTIAANGFASLGIATDMAGRRARKYADNITVSPQ
jgi:hypothetical protein